MRHGGRLAVLHVVAPFHPPPEVVGWLRDVEDVRAQLKRLEEVVRKRVGRRRVPFTCKVVIGNPLDRILDAARGADVIIMATQGRTGLPHLLIGSVAERVVRHAITPVLTVRRTRAAVSRPRHARR